VPEYDRQPGCCSRVVCRRVQESQQVCDLIHIFSTSDTPFRKQPLLVFDGESFWHVLHGSNLPKLFGGQFIQVSLTRKSSIKYFSSQFRKKAEDFCKRLTQLGFKLAFIFGNSPISAETKAEERGKQTLLHLTSFYRQVNIHLYFEFRLSESLEYEDKKSKLLVKALAFNNCFDVRILLTAVFVN